MCCQVEVFCFQIRRERLTIFCKIQLIANCTCNGRSVFDLFHVGLSCIFLSQGSMGRKCLLVFIGSSARCCFQPTECDFFLSDSCMTIDVGYVTIPVSIVLCMNNFFQIVICQFLSRRKRSNVFFSLVCDLFQVVVTQSTFLVQGKDDLGWISL